MGYPKSKRCPRCQDSINRVRDKEFKSTGPKRALGSIDQCTVCGNDYVVNSGMQKYCAQCASEATHKSDKASSVAWNQSHKDEIYPTKNRLRRQDRFCVVCGKPILAKTSTVTCGSPECARKRKTAWQQQAQYNQGRRKTPPPGYSPTK